MKAMNKILNYLAYFTIVLLFLVVQIFFIDADVTNLDEFSVEIISCIAIAYASVAYLVFAKKYLYLFDALFVLLFPCYYLFSYVFSVYLGFSPFSTSLATANEVLFICTSAWFVSVFILLLRPKGVSVQRYFTAFARFQSLAHRSNMSFVFAFPIALAVSLFFFSSVASLSFAQLLTSSRLELISQVGEQGWYLKYLIIAYAWVLCVYAMEFGPRKLLLKAYLLIPLVLYAISLILVGSRRELLFIIAFFGFYYYVKCQGVIQVRFVIIFACAVLALISLGVVRAQGDDQIQLYINAFGEFLFPISTLYYFVENGVKGVGVGESYIQVFLNFVPKNIYPDKPLSLAVQFAELVAPPGAQFIMGYAFTPVTEAYVNFGKWAIGVLPLTVLLISYLSEFIARRYVFIPIILGAQALNFQRGEFSSFLFEVIMLCVCFYFFMLLSRCRFR